MNTNANKLFTGQSLNLLHANSSRLVMKTDKWYVTNQSMR